MNIFEVTEVAQPMIDDQEYVNEQAAENFSEMSFMELDEEEDEDMADMMNYILNG